MVNIKTKYRVLLTTDERNKLKHIIKHENISAYRIKRAKILLALDEIPENSHWTLEKISDNYKYCIETIKHIRKNFLKQGLDTTLQNKRKIDPETEAKIMALFSSKAPDGHKRWTTRLLAEKLVTLGIMESISHTAIANTLQKNKNAFSGIKKKKSQLC